MNQLDIETRIDKELMQVEIELEKRLRKLQKTILAQLAGMYAKYERDGILTASEMAKYNRLDKELATINETLTAEYKQVVQGVQQMQENHYVLKFLLTAYLLNQFIARPTLPTTEVITAVFIFIAGALKLPRLPKAGEYDAVKAIERTFKEGIANNDTKGELIKRIEKALPSTMKDSASQLTDSLIERIETPVNVIDVQLPSAVDSKVAVKPDDKALTLPKIFTGHRNKLSKGVHDAIKEGLKKGESYSQVAKRLEKQFDMSVNRARLVARTESGRARSIANEEVFQQVAEFNSASKVWASALDSRVRKTHRKLDGEEANKKGLFVYTANTAVAPRLFIGPDAPSLNINCRCTVILKVDGKLPEYRRGRNYTDEAYQQRLADRIDSLMANESKTYKQALKKAQKEVLPPSVVLPYLTFNDWFKKLSERN